MPREATGRAECGRRGMVLHMARLATESASRKVGRNSVAITSKPSMIGSGRSVIAEDGAGAGVEAPPWSIAPKPRKMESKPLPLPPPPPGLVA